MIIDKQAFTCSMITELENELIRAEILKDALMQYAYVFTPGTATTLDYTGYTYALALVKDEREHIQTLRTKIDALRSIIKERD